MLWQKELLLTLIACISELGVNAESRTSLEGFNTFRRQKRNLPVSPRRWHRFNRVFWWDATHDQPAIQHAFIHANLNVVCLPSLAVRLVVSLVVVDTSQPTVCRQVHSVVGVNPLEGQVSSVFEDLGLLVRLEYQS